MVVTVAVIRYRRCWGGGGGGGGDSSQIQKSDQIQKVLEWWW